MAVLAAGQAGEEIGRHPVHQLDEEAVGERAHHVDRQLVHDVRRDRDLVLDVAEDVETLVDDEPMSGYSRAMGVSVGTLNIVVSMAWIFMGSSKRE